jgi:enamine deaminase RidA (YjgF/YER057c/UK114 family)
MTIESRLQALGLELPQPATPVASYVPFVRSGALVHISGQLTFDAAGSLILGRLGETLDVVRGREAAERCALGLLAQLRVAAGDFDQVARIVKLGVFIACTDDFTAHPEVANGASDLFVALFADAGRHARSAVGVPALPRGVPVEIDAVVELADRQ